MFRTLLIDNKAAKAVIKNKHVCAVTLTGSTAAGQSVASTAGKALKKCVLELGGSDPYLILADADLEQAAAACASSRLINSGQSCIAAKRFIVVESVREEFERLFVARMGMAKMGDPLDETTPSAHRPAAISATNCTNKSSAASPRVRVASSADKFRPVPGLIIRPPC